MVMVSRHFLYLASSCCHTSTWVAVVNKMNVHPAACRLCVRLLSGDGDCSLMVCGCFLELKWSEYISSICCVGCAHSEAQLSGSRREESAPCSAETRCLTWRNTYPCETWSHSPNVCKVILKYLVNVCIHKKKYLLLEILQHMLTLYDITLQIDVS